MRQSIVLLFSFVIIFLCSFLSIAQVNSGVYPQNKAVLSDTSFTLSWNKNTNAIKYIIQVDNSPSFISPVIYDSTASNTFSTTGLDFENKYYWRVRSFNGAYSNWSVVKTFTVFNPNTVSSIGIWLDADTNIVFETGKVREWQDLSPNANDMYQYNTVLQPQWEDSIINNKPCVHFTNILDYLNFTDTIDTLGGTLFTILRNDLGTGSYIIGYANYTNGPGLFVSNTLSRFWFNGNRQVTVNYITNNDFLLISCRQDTISYGPLWESYYAHIENNNNIGDSSYTYGFTFAMNWLGTTNWYGGKKECEGYMAELIYYYDPLNDSLFELNKDYLHYKYAPPINLGYDSIVEHGFCPVVLRADTGYTSYLWSTGATADTCEVTESGTYWCEVTSVLGRTSRDTVLVSFPSVSLSDTAFCLTDTVTMNTGLDHAYTFLWSDASSDSLLDVFAPGTYWVEITDSTLAACSVRDTFVVAVDSFPVLASLGPDTSLCTGDLFSLQSEVGNGYSYNWSTGSSDSAIVISTADTYYLTVTNNNSCIAVDTVDIAIKGVKPVAVFSNGTVCLGDSTNFVDMSYTLAPDGINNILFDFNDGDSSTASNPYHSFASAGDFMVRLEVLSDSGCYADTAISVHVRDLPNADFLPFNGCNGKLINFSDSSDEAEGSIALWEWDFGDGNTSSQQNPTHTYDSVDVYNTNLIISDIYGCSDTAIAPVNVRLTPIADFDYDESCLGQKTYFTELTNMPNYAEIIYRKWEFGDGNYSLLQNPQHTYDAIGTYNVLLINKSINGCIDSIQKSIIVHPFPTVGFISDTACKNRIVCFTDTSSVLYSSIVNREWDFDVAGTNTGDSIACTSFPDEGVFSVQLIVTSEYGCSAIANEKITVHPNPIADFSVIPEYGVPPLDVQFYNYTSGADSWYWLFGDGGISTLEHPAYTYNSESIFNVMLVAENEFSCTDTAYGNIYVIPSILDLVLNSIEVNDSNGYLYLTIEFYNNGTRNIRDIALDARIGSNLPVRESWSGLLLPGEQSSYSFTAAFLKPETENIRTICVEGTVLDSYGQEDEKPEDNTICYSLLDEFFIASIYPSPADENITVNISIPDNGDLSLFICSEDGKIVREGVYSDLDEGTLRVRIDVENLAGGVYVIHAQYKDKEDSVKFVKE